MNGINREQQRNEVYMMRCHHHAVLRDLKRWQYDTYVKDGNLAMMNNLDTCEFDQVCKTCDQRQNCWYFKDCSIDHATLAALYDSIAEEYYGIL
jgi:hypothetical protein